jgi:hypothetical protein
MRHFTAILTLIIVTTLFACSDTRFSDKNIEAKAVSITKKLDSQSIKTFYEWGFGHRGDADIFTKHSDNPDSGFYSYSCFYFKSTDRIKLSISRIENFKKDFPFDIQIDTSKFYRVDFTKLKNSSVRISAVDNHGQDQIIIEDIPVQTLFVSNDPFKKFKHLYEFKDSLGFLGNFYRPDIGNFIQLYLTNQHVLTYLPDTLQINPKFKDIWMGYFSTGKTLSTHWNFRKLENPIDNG